MIRGYTKTAQLESGLQDCEYLNSVIQATESLEQTVENLESLQRVIQTSSQSEEFDPCAHLRDIVADYEAKYTVDIDVTIEHNFTVQTHPQLSDAIEELLVNAIQHNSMQDTSIMVRSYTENGFLHIEVCDTGAGIPDTELQALAEKRETPLQHTTGTGLWLVDRIVYYSGGSLTFTIDGGTVARISIPKSLDG